MSDDDDDLTEMVFQDERICERCGLDADPIVSAVSIGGRLLCARCVADVFGSH